MNLFTDLRIFSSRQQCNTTSPLPHMTLTMTLNTFLWSQGFYERPKNEIICIWVRKQRNLWRLIYFFSLLALLHLLRVESVALSVIQMKSSLKIKFFKRNLEKRTKNDWWGFTLITNIKFPLYRRYIYKIHVPLQR